MQTQQALSYTVYGGLKCKNTMTKQIRGLYCEDYNLKNVPTTQTLEEYENKGLTHLLCRKTNFVGPYREGTFEILSETLKNLEKTNITPVVVFDAFYKHTPYYTPPNDLEHQNNVCEGIISVINEFGVERFITQDYDCPGNYWNPNNNKEITKQITRFAKNITQTIKDHTNHKGWFAPGGGHGLGNYHGYNPQKLYKVVDYLAQYFYRNNNKPHSYVSDYMSNLGCINDKVIPILSCSSYTSNYTAKEITKDINIVLNLHGDNYIIWHSGIMPPDLVFKKEYRRLTLNRRFVESRKIRQVIP